MFRPPVPLLEIPEEEEKKTNETTEDKKKENETAEEDQEKKDNATDSESTETVKKEDLILDWAHTAEGIAETEAAKLAKEKEEKEEKEEKKTTPGTQQNEENDRPTVQEDTPTTTTTTTTSNTTTTTTAMIPPPVAGPSLRFPPPPLSVTMKSHDTQIQSALDAKGFEGLKKCHVIRERKVGPNMDQTRYIVVSEIDGTFIVAAMVENGTFSTFEKRKT